jgi:ribonucleoside-diphosphate reductase alpha chain
MNAASLEGKTQGPGKPTAVAVREETGSPAGCTMNERPRELPGQTIKIKTGCGSLYVTINRLGERCYELFARAGKAGGCAASQCEAIGRLISLAWRKGAQPEEVVEQLRGICCQQKNEEDSEQARSCVDGVARAIEMAEFCTNVERVIERSKKEEHHDYEQVNSKDNGSVHQQNISTHEHCNCE